MIKCNKTQSNLASSATSPRFHSSALRVCPRRRAILSMLRWSENSSAMTVNCMSQQPTRFVWNVKQSVNATMSWCLRRERPKRFWRVKWPQPIRSTPKNISTSTLQVCTTKRQQFPTQFNSPVDRARTSKRCVPVQLTSISSIMKSWRQRRKRKSQHNPRQLKGGKASNMSRRRVKRNSRREHTRLRSGCSQHSKNESWISWLTLNIWKIHYLTQMFDCRSVSYQTVEKSFCISATMCTTWSSIIRLR